MSEPVNVPLPMLGLTMSEGAVARWLREEGDRVRKGDPLFEVETDKAVLDVEAPADGVLLRRLVAENQTVAVGTTVAIIGEPGQAPGPPSAPAARKTATPRARKLAEERNIDWRALEGTGPNGLVTEDDVKRAVPGRGPDAAEKPSHVRKVLIERLTRSARENVHIYLTVTVDMSAARNLPLSDLFIKAAALCLAGFPALNSGQPVPNIGFAVAVDDDNLFVPVIRNAAGKSLAEIGEARRALTAKARAKRLAPDDMSGGTFTISNLGMYGVEQFTAIINPPESAILAIGAVRDEVRAVGGAPAVRAVTTVTLAADHRVVDGAPAARFLARFKSLLENPEALA